LAAITSFMPITVLAPGRLRMMMGWPSSADTWGATMRSTWSVPPPAWYGTTILMGWLGKPSAALAAPAATATAVRAMAPRIFFIVSPACVCLVRVLLQAV